MHAVELAQLRRLRCRARSRSHRAARRAGRRARCARRARRGSSPRSTAAAASGARRAASRRSTPRVRRGDGALGPDDGRGRGEQVGDVARGLTEAGAGRRPLEAGDGHGASSSTQEVVAVEAAVRDVRGAEAAELGPRVVEDGVGDDCRAGSRTAACPGPGARRAARPGPRCRRTRRPGTRTPAPAASSSRYASYSTCWRRVQSSVRGASLRVRNRHVRAISWASASSRPSAVTCSWPAGRSTRRTPPGRPAARSSGSTLGDLEVEAAPAPWRRRSAVGRPIGRAERVVHGGGDAPAEHDRAEEVGRERVVDVQRLERDRRRRAPGRSGASVARGTATRPRPSRRRPRAGRWGSAARR